MKNDVWFNRMIMAIFVLLLSGCLRAAQPQQTREDAKNIRTFVFECNPSFLFVAQIEDHTAWLFLPQKTLGLSRVPAGSGEKFGDELTTFWVEGDTAVLQNNNTTYRNCINNRSMAIWEHAKLNGVDFRAIGNEPGWYLEIRNQDTILFVGDYGNSRYEFATPEPLINQQKHTTIYQTAAGGKSMTITLEGRQCQDTMSGESFATTVRVALDHQHYQGCGRALH